MNGMINIIEKNVKRGGYRKGSIKVKDNRSTLLLSDNDDNNVNNDDNNDDNNVNNDDNNVNNQLDNAKNDNDNNDNNNNNNKINDDNYDNGNNAIDQNSNNNDNIQKKTKKKKLKSSSIIEEEEHHHHDEIDSGHVDINNNNTTINNNNNNNYNNDEEWIELYDEESREFYFWNTLTDETTWTKPGVKQKKLKKKNKKNKKTNLQENNDDNNNISQEPSTINITDKVEELFVNDTEQENVETTVVEVVQPSTIDNDIDLESDQLKTVQIDNIANSKTTITATDPWTEIVDDESGQSYWWNSETNETTHLGAEKPTENNKNDVKIAELDIMNNVESININHYAEPINDNHKTVLSVESNNDDLNTYNIVLERNEQNPTLLRENVSYFNDNNNNNNNHDDINKDNNNNYNSNNENVKIISEDLISNEIKNDNTNNITKMIPAKSNNQTAATTTITSITTNNNKRKHKESGFGKFFADMFKVVFDLSSSSSSTTIKTVTTSNETFSKAISTNKEKDNNHNNNSYNSSNKDCNKIVSETTTNKEVTLESSSIIEEKTVEGVFEILNNENLSKLTMDNSSGYSSSIKVERCKICTLPIFTCKHSMIKVDTNNIKDTLKKQTIRNDWKSKINYPPIRSNHVTKTDNNDTYYVSEHNETLSLKWINDQNKLRNDLFTVIVSSFDTNEKKEININKRNDTIIKAINHSIQDKFFSNNMNDLKQAATIYRDQQKIIDIDLKQNLHLQGPLSNYPVIQSSPKNQKSSLSISSPRNQNCKNIIIGKTKNSLTFLPTSNL